MKPFEPTCTGVPPCGRCWSCEADQRDAEAARGREALDVLRETMARVDALVFHRDADTGVVTVQDCPIERFTAMVEDFDRARALLSRSGGTPT